MPSGSKLRRMLDRAVDVAADDPDEFVRQLRETGRVAQRVLAEGGKKADEAYQQVRTPERAKRTIRNAVIKKVAAEVKRRRGV